jgi:hypothetical protein
MRARGVAKAEHPRADDIEHKAPEERSVREGGRRGERARRCGMENDMKWKFGLAVGLCVVEAASTAGGAVRPGRLRLRRARSLRTVCSGGGILHWAPPRG